MDMGVVVIVICVLACGGCCSGLTLEVVLLRCLLPLSVDRTSMTECSMATGVELLCSCGVGV
jgi:hypothetical protein